MEQQSGGPGSGQDGAFRSSVFNALDGGPRPPGEPVEGSASRVGEGEGEAEDSLASPAFFGSGKNSLKACNDYWTKYELEKKKKEANFEKYTMQLEGIKSKLSESNGNIPNTTSSIYPSLHQLSISPTPSPDPTTPSQLPTPIPQYQSAPITPLPPLQPQPPPASQFPLQPQPPSQAPAPTPAQNEDPTEEEWEMIDSIVIDVNSNIHVSETAAEKANLEKFKVILSKDRIDIRDLSTKALTNNLPPEVRAEIWQICLGYLSLDKKSWGVQLRLKREEYVSLVLKWWPPPNSTDVGNAVGDKTQLLKDKALYNLIVLDVLRTHPNDFCKLFEHPLVRLSLERILYIWSKENEEISYFQGLNDIVCPFLIVYLTSCFGAVNDRNHNFEHNLRMQNIEKYICAIEADAYWSLQIIFKNLRSVVSFHSGYVHAEAMMTKFFLIMEQADPKLVEHLREIGIDFSHFSFRWLLCFMAREFTTKNLLHLWDSYLAFGEKGFGHFHAYVCAAMLCSLSGMLQETKSMSKCLYILQKPPSAYWGEEDISSLIQKAILLEKKHKF